MPDMVIYIVKNAVVCLIDVIQLAMLVRAVLSWFQPDSDAINKVAAFVISITEPLIYPIRILFEKLGLFKSIPIDLPFLFTWLILTFISLILI